MRIADRILSLLLHRDVAGERARLDAAIEANRSDLRQNTQALQSGARMIRTMSGMLRLQLAEHHLAQIDQE